MQVYVLEQQRKHGFLGRIETRLLAISMLTEDSACTLSAPGTGGNIILGWFIQQRMLTIFMQEKRGEEGLRKIYRNV